MLAQVLGFSNSSTPISSTMIGAEKGGVGRKGPFVSCIRLNGVPILPPIMDRSTKTMAMEAKNRALQLELEFGWAPAYQKQNCSEKLAVGRRGNTVSVPVHNRASSRGAKGAADALPQCTCGRKESLLFSQTFTSAPCLTDGLLRAGLSAVPWRKRPDSSSASRSSFVPFSQSTGSMKLLRKCSSAESLPVRDRYENKSAADCSRCRRGPMSNPVFVFGSRLFSSEQQRVRNFKVTSPPKGLEGNRSQVTYVKGGGVASTESELSLASLQKHSPSRESNNSVSDSTWAAGFYRQLFPVGFEVDRSFDTESSDDSSIVRVPEAMSGKAAESGGGSRSASSNYASARDSSALLLDVPSLSSADSDRNGGYRLVRQGSYVLDKPSEVLLEHLKKQSCSAADDGPHPPARPTKESSVQTKIDVFELFDNEDDSADSSARAKVSELREKLRRRFDAAMESLLVKQRQEQDELAETFLQLQQSTLLQMKASAVINAAARGYLIRRLMKTKHVEDLIETMEESLKCIFELKGEALRPLRADQELYDRLLQQLTAACTTFYETFFDTSIADRMKIIAADRERLKYLQLKAASLGLHSIRPATR